MSKQSSVSNDSSQKCGTCAVEVKHNTNCPLCGKYVGGTERAERYPTYFASGGVRVKLLLRFLFVFAGAIVFFIDFVTVFKGWSIVTIGGLVIVWFAVIRPIFDRVGFPSVMVQIVLVIALWMAILQIASTFENWPVAYIIPSACAFGITAIIFSTIFRQVKWGEISIYLVILALINLVIVILGLANIITSVLLALIVLAYSVIILVTFKIFLSKSFNESFKKKMRV